MLTCAVAVALVSLVLADISRAVEIPLVESKSLWQYTVLDFDLWGKDPDGTGPLMGDKWSGSGYSSFDWDNAAWIEGRAVFGSVTHPFYPGSYETFWAQDTDLALQQSFLATVLPALRLTLSVGSDNGFMIFLNGVQVAKENEEGYTTNPYAIAPQDWEYTYNIDPSLLVSGVNTIRVLAEDHWSPGDQTFFDMKAGYHAVPVPAPGTILLLGTGLLGLAGCRLFRKRAGKE